MLSVLFGIPDVSDLHLGPNVEINNGCICEALFFGEEE
jgi:hypothetical protein